MKVPLSRNEHHFEGESKGNPKTLTVFNGTVTVLFFYGERTPLNPITDRFLEILRRNCLFRETAFYPE